MKSASQNMLFGVFASRASPDRPSNVTFFAIDYTTGSTKVLLFLNMVYPANFIQSCVVDDATRRFTFLAYNTRDHPGFKQYLATIDYDALLLIGQWQLLPSVFQGEVVDLKIVNSQLTCLVAQTVDKWYAYFGKFNITKVWLNPPILPLVNYYFFSERWIDITSTHSGSMDCLCYRICI
jgi:hypothetical protein